MEGQDQVTGRPPAPAKRALKAHRVLVLLAESVGALVGLGLLAVGALAIRLAFGPLELDSLTPLVTASLDTALAPLTVTAQRTHVRLDLHSLTLGLDAEAVRVAAPDGTVQATTPDIAVDLALGPLLIGEIVPRRLRLDRPVLDLIRAGEDDIALPANPDILADIAPNVPTPAAPQWLRMLVEPGPAARRLADLQAVSVTGGTVNIADKLAGKRWSVADLAVGLTRSGQAIDAALSARLVVPDLDPAPVKAAFRLDPATRRLSGAVDIGTIVPAALTPLLPVVPELAGLRLPVTSHIDGGYALDEMEPTDIAVSVTFGRGELAAAAVPGGAVAIAGGEARVRWQRQTGQVTIDQARMDLGGPVLTVAGRIDKVDADMLQGDPADQPALARLHVAIKALPVTRLPALWPEGVAAGGKAWVAANMSDGMIDDAGIDATLALDPAGARKVTMRGLSGGMHIRDAVITYLDGLPKLEGAAATVKFAPDRIDFAMTDGHMKRLAITSGLITIDQFDAPIERITIDLGLKGPVRDLMEALDADRLKLTRGMGLVAGRIGGALDGTLHFRFPLSKSVTFAQMEIGAKAAVTGLAVPQVALGQDLTAGTVDVTLGATDLTLVGKAQVGGAPAAIDFRQRVSGDATPMTEAKVSIRVDDAMRKRLRLDFDPDRLHGPLNADIRYAAEDAHRASVDLAADLTPSTVDLPWVGWTKRPGAAAHATGRLVLADGKVIRLERLKLAGAGIEAAGAADFGPGGAIERARLDRVVTATSDVGMTIEPIADHGLAVSVKGASLDLSNLLKSGKASPADKQAPAGPAEPEKRPIRFEAAVDRLILGERRQVTAASGRGLWDGETLAELMLSGRFATKGGFALELLPVAAGGRIAAQVDDAGELLRVGGITDHVVGGAVSLNGVATQGTDGRRFAAHLEAANYSVVRTPVLARLLAVASLDSMASLLQGGGIPFSTLKADLILEQHRLTLSHARTYGGSLGINLDGPIDFKAGTIDLAGTLVPAYSINSLLSDVPVIGDALAGGKGEGLFAFNIAIGGALAEPSLSVNPLSVFAPGFLRRLFLFEAPTASAKASGREGG